MIDELLVKSYQASFDGLEREFERVDRANCSPEIKERAYGWLSWMKSILTDRFIEDCGGYIRSKLTKI